MNDKVLIWMWVGCSIATIVGTILNSEYSILPIFLAFGATSLNLIIS